MQTMTKKIQKDLSVCTRCGKKIDVSALLDNDGEKLCVDCVVREEMETLAAEIENDKKSPSF